MRLPPNLSLDTIADAVAGRLHNLDNPGFCLYCGAQNDGCEPDAENYRCESCGTFNVFGAEQLLIMFA
jgi:hypothetical protein